MSLKRPVTIAQARQWPAAAARRKSFCARMGGMRDKLTSDRVAMDPRSKINRALAAWDCDVPELLDRKHVKKGIRPMKITSKMVGAEARKARKNPIGRQETYALAEENLATLKKRYQTLLLTMADLRDSLRRRKKGLPDDDMRGYTDAEISKLIKHYQTRAEDLRGAIAEYESGNWWKNPARKAAKPTVSRKISQLVREGYPQRQAVAIALSEQRAGKVQKIPRKAAPAEPRMVYQVQHSRDGKGYMVWGTYLYEEMAKHVARMRAVEAPHEFVRVVSLEVDA